MEQNQIVEEQEDKNDHTMLYAWGSAEFDQFQIPGGEFETKKPIKIPYFFQNNLKISKIACGSQHTLILTSNGQLFSMGSSDEGAIGRDGFGKLPDQVKLPIKVDLISCGDCHSVAANSQNGIVYTWGVYRNAEKGNMSPVARYPQSIGVNEFKGKKIKKLLSGSNHTLVFSKNKVYAWGDPDTCVLGRMPLKRRKFEQALRVGGLGFRNVQDIFTGGNHAFIITERYSRKEKRSFKCLYGWGLNNWGQLGCGLGTNSYKAKELEQMREKEILDIVGGEYHTLILLKNGEVYGCGRNDDNQLGPLDKEEAAKLTEQTESVVKREYPDTIYYPVKIKLEEETQKVMARGQYCYAVGKSGAIRSWGLGFSYILANGKEEEISEPHKINPKFLRTDVGVMALGTNHVMFTGGEKEKFLEGAELEPEVVQVLSKKSKLRLKREKKMAEKEKSEKAKAGLKRSRKEAELSSASEEQGSRKRILTNE